MIANKFETPIGVFKVCRNLEKEAFIIEKRKGNAYWVNNNKVLYGESCYKISIDLINSYLFI